MTIWLSQSCTTASTAPGRHQYAGRNDVRRQRGPATYCHLLFYATIRSASDLFGSLLQLRPYAHWVRCRTTSRVWACTSSGNILLQRPRVLSEFNEGSPRCRIVFWDRVRVRIRKDCADQRYGGRMRAARTRLLRTGIHRCRTSASLPRQWSLQPRLALSFGTDRFSGPTVPLDALFERHTRDVTRSLRSVTGLALTFPFI